MRCLTYIVYIVCCPPHYSCFMFLIFISVPFVSWKRFHRGSPSIFRNNNFKGSSFQWTLIPPTTLNPFSNRSTLQGTISSYFFAMIDLATKNAKWFTRHFLSPTYSCLLLLQIFRS